MALFGMITFAEELGAHRATAEAGLTAGLDEPSCAALLLDMEQKGLPRPLWREAGQFYRRSLMAEDPEECAEAHAALREARGG